MTKGQLINAKLVEMDMCLERIEKMLEVQNLLLDLLNIQNGSKRLVPISLQDSSPCTHCSRLDHIEQDCLVMACIDKAHKQDQVNWEYEIIMVHTQIIIITIFLEQSFIACRV